MFSTYILFEQSFKIYWTDAILQSATDGRVYVDGHFSGGQNLRPGRASNLACKRGVRTSTETTRPFVFSSVNLTGTLHDSTLPLSLPTSLH